MKAYYKAEIILAIVLMTIAAVMINIGTVAATVFILDSQWTEYTKAQNVLHVNQLATAYENGAQEAFYRTMYTGCLSRWQDTITCIAMTQTAYDEAWHEYEPPPGWNWFKVKHRGRQG